LRLPKRVGNTTEWNRIVAQTVVVKPQQHVAADQEIFAWLEFKSETTLDGVEASNDSSGVRELSAGSRARRKWSASIYGQQTLLVYHVFAQVISGKG
jgi:hypothetical protein